MSDEWLDVAACRGMDTNLFYPSEHHPEQAVVAMAVCRGCEVKQACLDDAIADKEFGHYGIRGGTTARYRKRIRVQGRDLMRMIPTG